MRRRFKALFEFLTDRRIQVQVLWRHILGATKNNPCFCPVARALQEALGPGNPVRVHSFLDGDFEFCRVAVPSLSWSFPVAEADWVKIPADVSRRIREFDATGIMLPFSFRIRVPRW